MWSTRSSLGLISKIKHWNTGVQWWITKMIKELEHMMYKERLEKNGFFSVRRRMLRGDPIPVFSYVCGEQRENEGVQWQNKRQQTQVVTKEIPFRNEDGIFHLNGGQMLEQISQRCCGISILEDTKNWTDRTGPWESALSWPFFERGFD